MSDDLVIVRIAERELARGALSEAELVRRVLESRDCPVLMRGDPNARDDVIEILRNDEHFWDSIDRSFSLLEKLVSPVTLTHLVGPDELTGTVSVVPNLELGLLGLQGPIRWSVSTGGLDGFVASEEGDADGAGVDFGTLLLPERRDPFAQYVALSRDGARLRCEWLAEPPSYGEGERRFLAEAARTWLSYVERVDVVSLVLHARSVDPNLFTVPTMPISVMLESSGYRCVDGFVHRSAE